MKLSKGKKIAIVTIPLVLICIIAAAIALIMYSYSHRLYTQCVAEAGTVVVAEDFLRDTEKTAIFTEDSPAIHTNIPGDYHVTVRSGIFTYDCTVTIQDTVPPVVTCQKKYIEPGETVVAEDFITSTEDVTALTVAFQKAPDYTVYGEQIISVQVTDLGGNTTICETSLITRSVKAEITMEAGSTVPAVSEFLINHNPAAAFTTDTSAIDTDIPGDYPLEIAVDDTVYPTTLHIVDTTAPTLELQDVTRYTYNTPEMEDFIVGADDVTELTYTYVKEPDFSIIGKQEVTIRVTDTSGNSTEKHASLTLKKDTDTPTISGVKDITAYLGQSINYKKGVSVKDKTDSNVTLSVDTSDVNTKAEGSYPVTYTAKDRSGNKTSVTITLTLKKRVYSSDVVYAEADKVLNKIITNGMSQREQLTAIYKWVQSNIAYVHSSNHSDWKKAAYDGLTNHRGDCFVYASVSKALLTRAGIKNMDIHKIPTSTEHYWNLVDIGEGWYHFDTTPRAERPKPNFCYVNDATLMAFSNKYYNSHRYDRTVYTDIQ